ncbi:MAG TPA: hypothetical protein PLR99_16535 [Polyangiaceae bacterium]|nr:hypothetical protein [Polyangiaceae bacterium]
MPRPTAFAYAAHAGSNTFLLDEDGICRRILTRGKNRQSTNKSTQRCLGAQYVASLDFDSESGLVERPKEGCPLLFARVDEHGRVSLVRTAPLERFEEVDRELDTEEHFALETLGFDEDRRRTRPPPPTRREPAPATRRDPSPAVRREPAPPTRKDAPPTTRRDRPVVRPRNTEIPPTRPLDIDYGGQRLRTHDARTDELRAHDGRRDLPGLEEEDDFATTVVAERPAAFSKKRGMLPRGRSDAPPPNERADRKPTLQPPPPGRRGGR